LPNTLSLSLCGQHSLLSILSFTTLLLFLKIMSVCLLNHFSVCTLQIKLAKEDLTLPCLITHYPLRVCVFLCSSKPTPFHSNQYKKWGKKNDCIGWACWWHCCLILECTYGAAQHNNDTHSHVRLCAHTLWMDGLLQEWCQPKPLQLPLEWKQWGPRATLNSSDYLSSCQSSFTLSFCPSLDYSPSVRLSSALVLKDCST